MVKNYNFSDFPKSGNCHFSIFNKLKYIKMSTVTKNKEEIKKCLDKWFDFVVEKNDMDLQEIVKITDIINNEDLLNKSVVVLDNSYRENCLNFYYSGTIITYRNQVGSDIYETIESWVKSPKTIFMHFDYSLLPQDIKNRNDERQKFIREKLYKKIYSLNYY